MSLNHRRQPKDISDERPINDNAKPQKRWSLACKTIYFIVALSKKKILHKKSAALSRSPSYVVLDVNSDLSSIVIHENVQHTRPLFSIDQNTLTSMTRDRSLEYLSQLGGVSHLAIKLGTNGMVGVSTHDILCRQTVFGSNVLPKPPKRRFLMFVNDAFKDTVIIILMVCASLSLVFGIKQHGLKEGWYDGGSIIIAIIVVVLVSAISNFKQSRQFVKRE